MLRTIILIIIGYVVIQFVYGLWKFQKVLRKGTREMSRHRSATRERETRTTEANKKRKSSSKDEGNYIDYEEID